MARALTPKALGAGVGIGVLLCFSNTYFGLQSGWVTMGSLQSAILGAGFFRALQFCLPELPFTAEENVVLQTAAVATATMPLAAGFVGVLPAMTQLRADETRGVGPIHFSFGSLLLRTSALAFLGLFTAPPLRRQVIINEKLPFPSGSATAKVISVLHSHQAQQRAPVVPRRARPGHGYSAVPVPSTSAGPEDALEAGLAKHDDAPIAVGTRSEAGVGGTEAPLGSPGALPSRNAWSDAGGGKREVGVKSREWEERRLSGSCARGHSDGHAGAEESIEDPSQMWVPLGASFALSFAYHLAAWAWPALRAWDVFGSLGWSAPGHWGWVLQPSMGYIGQGVLMGPRVALSMLLGAIVGWAVLGPAAKASGWAPGPISSWEDGATGWLLWVAMAIMLADTLSSLGLFVIAQVARRHRRGGAKASRDRELQQLGGLAADGASNVGRCSGVEFSSGCLTCHVRKSPRAAHDPYAALDASDGSGCSTRAAGTHGTEAGTGEGSTRLMAGIVRSGPVGCEGVEVSGDARDRKGEGFGAVSCANGAGREMGAGSGMRGDGGGASIPVVWWAGGMVISTVLCTVVMTSMFDLPVYEPLVAVVLGAPVSVLAVRALGETDLNPVSAIAKLLQLAFAGVAPGNLVSNLVAGAIAEAGAMQAGDLMQDFKTAHLLGVSPRDQFIAMLLGATCSIFASVAAFALYTRGGPLPNDRFPAPTAAVWLDMARLVNGGALPRMAWPFCLAFGALAVAGQAFLAGGKGRVRPAVLALVPSGVGFAVGMYLQPKWIIPRVVGGLLELGRQRGWLQVQKQTLVVVASGMVLGEGIASIIGAFLGSHKVF